MNKSMRKNCFILIFAILSFLLCGGSNGESSDAPSADIDGTIMFLHHSTGGGVYYDGYMAKWFNAYNAANSKSYSLNRREYPGHNMGNYPYDWWYLWIGGGCNSDDPQIECLGTLAAKYDVIVIKNCYPGADVLPDLGTPDYVPRKSQENYKLMMRELRDLFDSYRDTKFVIWTLAPRHRLRANSPEESARAKLYVDWLNKEFLHETGKRHPNIYIFDFWSLVAELDPNPKFGKVNTLKYEFEIDHYKTDSHPNFAANNYVGPIFSQFLVDVIQK